MTIISVYGSQRGRNEEDKDRFYDNLSAKIQSKNGNCIVLGEFNGHVGSTINEYKGVYRRREWVTRSKNGERLLESADSFNMVVGSMFFKKMFRKLIK